MESTKSVLYTKPPIYLTEHVKWENSEKLNDSYRTQFIQIFKRDLILPDTKILINIC